MVNFPGDDMNSKTLVNRKTRRTTLTLEADVAYYVECKLASDKRLKEKNVINDLLRKGIRLDEAKKPEPFVLKPFKTKLAKGMTIRKLEELMREI
jgi:hypothetical protein